MAKKRRTELDLDLSSELPTAKEVELATPSAPPAVEEAPPEEKPSIWDKIPVKLVIIGGVLLLILAGLSTIAYVVLIKPSEVEKVEEMKKPTPTPIPYETLITYNMAPFFLPLDAPEGEKEFLSLQFTVEINNEEVRKELDRNLLLIRESILLYLQDKQEEDFRNPEKRGNTLDELKTVINRSLQSGFAKNVFVVEIYSR